MNSSENQRETPPPSRLKPPSTPNNLSRDSPAVINCDEKPQPFQHRLLGHLDTVLALAYHSELRRLYSGSQDQTIRVWCVDSLQCLRTLEGHSRSVLSLALSDDLLFSSGSDNSIRIWKIDTTPEICILTLAGRGVSVPRAPGHIFSLALTAQYLFAGCQDTTVKRIDLEAVKQHLPLFKTIEDSSPVQQEDGPSTAPQVRRASMDTVSTSYTDDMPEPHVGCADLMYSACGPTAAKERLSVCAWDRSFFGTDGDGLNNEHDANSVPVHQFSSTTSSQGKHVGYVYATCSYQDRCVTASGDGTVKIWNAADLQLVQTLTGHDGSVLALAVRKADPVLLFSGGSDCCIRSWELDSATFNLRRTCTGHSAPVQALAVNSSSLFSASADGVLKVWHLNTMVCQMTFESTKSGIFCVVTIDEYHCATGCSDGIKIWNLEEFGESLGSPCLLKARVDPKELLVDSLKRFVSFKSVSPVLSKLGISDEGWKAARWLQKKLISHIGAEARLISILEGRNPVVIGRIGNKPNRPTVTFYGHYDVMPATREGWRSDPWTLTSEDGYLYGRGASDDKGPILATLYAIKDILNEFQDLPVNVNFLYEGEEESDSAGLEECVEQNIDFFKGTDVLFVSNNYWIGDSSPCVTYGMRGRIQLEIEIEGAKRDLHSGVDGGTVFEPMVDLTTIMHSLVDSNGLVKIEGFYDDVDPISPEEEKLYEEIEFNADRHRENLGVGKLQETDVKYLLMRRWRQPCLSLHGIYTSGASVPSFSVIPRKATARISIRTVPHQDASKLVALITNHVKSLNDKLNTGNQLSVRVLHIGDYWLGDTTSMGFKAAHKAIERIWGTSPKYVREGGTISVTPMLERRLSCKAVHVPIGQSSDQAHLTNERIRLLNLVRGKGVIKEFLIHLGNSDGS